LDPRPLPLWRVAGCLSHPTPYQGNATVGKGSNDKDKAQQSYPQQVEVAGSNPLQVSHSINWPGFKDYLSKVCNNRNTAKVRMCYAKHYASVLTSLDIHNNNDLLQLSPQKRLNVMKSITLLSKYLGCYDRWQELRKRYHLKWSTGTESLQSFNRFFNDELSLDSMLKQVREMIDKTPPFMAQIIKFACLTGLRPAEAVESVRLINDKEVFAKYYRPERQAIEHFRFPSVFLRQTKKAYISFVTPEMLEECKLSNCRHFSVTYNAIRLTCRRKGINMGMRYCRKIFASYLHQCGISSEAIDFLQGRSSTSVLTRHYLTPDASLKNRVLESISKLKDILEK
jgi:hypothetical protein